MDFLTFFGLAAATWYVSYVLTSTHGPGGVFEWIREHVWHGRRSYTAAALVSNKGEVKQVERGHVKNGLLDCIVCLSFWIALILQGALLFKFDIIGALAIAGLAMLLHGFTNWRLG